MSSRHYEVTVEHVLLSLLDDPYSDINEVFSHFRVDVASARSYLQRYLSELRSGNAGKPVFDTLLWDWIQDAWIYASVELGEDKVRSGALLVRILVAPTKYLPTEMPILDRLPRDQVRKDLATIAGASGEAADDNKKSMRKPGEPGAEGAPGDGKAPATGLGKPDGPLAKFTTDLTERARAGEIDPVFGREAEIRQIVDILGRRRKNNPIIVGEAGVGKTALVEGLAVRIAE